MLFPSAKRRQSSGTSCSGGDTLVTQKTGPIWESLHVQSGNSQNHGGGVVKWALDSHVPPSGRYGADSIRSGGPARCSARGWVWDLGYPSIRDAGRQYSVHISAQRRAHLPTCGPTHGKGNRPSRTAGGDSISRGEVRYSDNIINRDNMGAQRWGRKYDFASERGTRGGESTAS